MLGSMCAAAAPGLLIGRDKQQQVLELFSVALGPSAAEALTSAAAGAGMPYSNHTMVESVLCQVLVANNSKHSSLP